MLAELERAYAKKEPVAVVLWSPHWAYSKYDLTELKDPKGTWGANNQIKTLGNKSFPKKFPEFNGWLKNWHMSPDELVAWSRRSRTAGKGNENKGVEKLDGGPPGHRRQDGAGEVAAPEARLSPRRRQLPSVGARSFSGSGGVRRRQNLRHSRCFFCTKASLTLPGTSLA